jgi:hypothetical protein
MEVAMRKRIAATVAAGITALALCAPSVGFANKGGVPHSTKACPAHTHSGKHKGAGHGKKKGALKGKKCGLK